MGNDSASAVSTSRRKEGSMSSNSFVQTIIAAVAVAACAGVATAQRTGGGDDLDARARAIHARVLVLDAHTDVLLDSCQTSPVGGHSLSLDRGPL